MGVRLAFRVGEGEWLELRRLDHTYFYAYITNEDMKICDQEIGQFEEKELGEAFMKLLYQLKENRKINQIDL
ncbi:hypothetical protein [Metabacillus niabensis]|uniref:hypothetical protein n=1 Tax=Metabacillus niabensis TaxID=324854 RepID=UPI001CFC1A92|nr:hypothetical protein [Metabacillus niabensis]